MLEVGHSGICLEILWVPSGQSQGLSLGPNQSQLRGAQLGLRITVSIPDSGPSLYCLSLGEIYFMPASTLAFLLCKMRGL